MGFIEPKTCISGPVSNTVTPVKKPVGPCDDIKDRISSQQPEIILPESQSPGRKYDCEDNIPLRPQRERVRNEIAEYVILMLGGPVVDLELDQQQISMAVNEALKIFEEWAPSEYFQYYTFETQSGISTYCMPCDIGIIRQVHYVPKSCDGASELGGSMPLGWIGDTGYGAGGLSYGSWGYNRHQPYWGYQGEWVAFKIYEEMFERTSSRNPGWEFVEDRHHIKIYPAPQGDGGTVTVSYVQKKKNWPEVHQFMQEYALALCKIMLGRIRSKYNSIVSPGGGVTLDGQNLLTEGVQEKKDLERDLIFKWNDQQDLMITLG
jgi:hypothetical protein